MDGVRFIGTTLWSDFDAMAMNEGVTDITRLHKLREKAFRAATCTCARRVEPVRASPFWPLPCAMKRLLCQDWLRAALQQTFDGPTVAVTHLRPACCFDPRYGLVPGTAGL